MSRQQIFSGHKKVKEGDRISDGQSWARRECYTIFYPSKKKFINTGHLGDILYFQ